MEILKYGNVFLVRKICNETVEIFTTKYFQILKGKKIRYSDTQYFFIP